MLQLPFFLIYFHLQKQRKYVIIIISKKREGGILTIKVPEVKLKLEDVSGGATDNFINLLSDYFDIGRDEAAEKVKNLSWQNDFILETGSYECIYTDMQIFMSLLEQYKDKKLRVSFATEGNEGVVPEYVEQVNTPKELAKGGSAELISSIISLRDKIVQFAKERSYRFVSLETILFVISKAREFEAAYGDLGGDVAGLRNDLLSYMDKHYKIPVRNNSTFMYTKDNEPGFAMYAYYFMEALPTYALLSNRKEVDSALELGYILPKPNHSLVTYVVSFVLSYKSPANTFFLRNLDFTPKQTFDKDMKQIFILWKKTINKHLPDDEKPFVKSTQFYRWWSTNILEEYYNRANNNAEPVFEQGTEYVKEDKYLKEIRGDAQLFIGRGKEINEIIEILLRKNNPNPIITGDHGVGTSSMIYGLVKKIESGEVPDLLKERKVFSLDSQSVIAGAGIMGSIEERLKKIIKKCSKNNSILFIDDMYEIGNQPAGAAFLTSLFQYMKDYPVSIIATASTEGFQSMRQNASFMRNFTRVIIPPMSKEETMEILTHSQKQFEDFHKVLYNKGTMEYIINATDYNMRNKNFPSKAIMVSDISMAHAVAKGKKVVEKEDVAEVIAKQLNTTKDMVSESENSMLENLPQNLKKNIIGQEEAIDKICSNLIMSKAGLIESNKPIASLLFVGPTGVGKTFLAQQLAEELHIPLIKKDMSEYSEPHNVARLFGSPPGYVGSENGGRLIQEINENPYCVLLLDEIEKAHPNVFDVFLQIMDDARLTDGRGTTADFHNVILIMTSNCGIADAMKLKPGFGTNLCQFSNEEVDKAVNRMFTPEFRNRLDGIIHFNPLSMPIAEGIVKNKLSQLVQKVKDKGIELEYSEEIIDMIKEKGYSQEYGARNIERTIQKEIYVQLSQKILFQHGNGKYVLVKGENGIIVKEH